MLRIKRLLSYYRYCKTRSILEVGYPDAALVAVKDEAGYRFWMDGGNGEIDGIPGIRPYARSSHQLCVWFACGREGKERQVTRSCEYICG